MAKQKQGKGKSKGRKTPKRPIIYLDTNIIRDWLRNRNRESVIFIAHVKEKKWDCVTSIFTFMELLDIEKDEIFFHKKVRQGWDINKIIRGRSKKKLNDSELEDAYEPISLFLTEEKIARPLALNEQGWNLALSISSDSTLYAPDSIHLAVAFMEGDLLVTNDEDFIKQATELLKEGEVWNNLRICKPKDA